MTRVSVEPELMYMDSDSLVSCLRLLNTVWNLHYSIVEGFKLLWRGYGQVVLKNKRGACGVPSTSLIMT